MAEPFIGDIRMGGWNFAPRGYAFCSGQLMAIAQNDALFALIGTTYGGDGQVTFALPDLRGRVPMHQGNGFIQGQISGAESITLSISQVPGHTHSLTASKASAASTTPVGTGFAASTPNLYVTPTSPVSTTSATSAAPSGGGTAHENRQPTLCISFVIALEGVFPSRN